MSLKRDSRFLRNKKLCNVLSEVEEMKHASYRMASFLNRRWHAGMLVSKRIIIVKLQIVGEI